MADRDRLFNLICSLLCNDYVVRVQRPGEGMEYDISDYEHGAEDEVSRCYNRTMSVAYPTLWVFTKDDWYDMPAEAVAEIALDTEGDRVMWTRFFVNEPFIEARVKESV